MKHAPKNDKITQTSYACTCKITYLYIIWTCYDIIYSGRLLSSLKNMSMNKIHKIVGEKQIKEI